MIDFELYAPRVMKKADKSQLIKSILDVIGFLLISVALILKGIYKLFVPKTYWSSKDLKGEIALVTGGGSGLGRLLALRLGKLGAIVVVWDINEQGVEETINLVKGIGGVAYGYKCNIANNEDVYKIAKKTQEDVGDVTLLINNAGVVSGELLLETPDHLIKRTFDVNIIAHFWTVKAFLPKMIEKNHGHIVTIASMAGHVGIKKLVDYCASKYAAVGFDEALRVELEAQGVTGVKTTVICPYFIQATGMFDNVNSRFLPRLKSNDVADITIDAIKYEETVVMIPKVMQYGLILKAMVPWSVISMFLRNLVPDAVPHAEPAKAAEPIKKVTQHLPQKNASLSDSVSQLNQRIITTEKNL